MIQAFVIGLSTFFGILRLSGSDSQSFQAFAHIWVTIVFCMGISNSQYYWVASLLTCIEVFAGANSRLSIGPAIGLTCLTALAFCLIAVCVSKYREWKNKERFMYN